MIHNARRGRRYGAPRRMVLDTARISTTASSAPWSTGCRIRPHHQRCRHMWSNPAVGKISARGLFGRVNITVPVQLSPLARWRRRAAARRGARWSRSTRRAGLSSPSTPRHSAFTRHPTTRTFPDDASEATVDVRQRGGVDSAPRSPVVPDGSVTGRIRRHRVAAVVAVLDRRRGALLLPNLAGRPSTSSIGPDGAA